MRYISRETISVQHYIHFRIPFIRTKAAMFFFCLVEVSRNVDTFDIWPNVFRLASNGNATGRHVLLSELYPYSTLLARLHSTFSQQQQSDLVFSFGHQVVPVALIRLMFG